MVGQRRSPILPVVYLIIYGGFTILFFTYSHEIEEDVSCFAVDNSNTPIVDETQ